MEKQTDGKQSLWAGWSSPPNLVTFSRIILVVVFLGLYIAAGPWGLRNVGMRWAAAVIFFIAASTDKLDGWLARKYNQVTELGKLMDPIADAEFISDEMLEVIALRVIPVVVNLLLLFMTASCARRMHDIGLSGAWGLLMLMPVFNVPMLVFSLCWPGSPLPTGWRMLADVIKREF